MPTVAGLGKVWGYVSGHSLDLELHPEYGLRKNISYIREIL